MMNDIDEVSEVVVSELPLSALTTGTPDPETIEWLRELWAYAPDFPDRPVDRAPEPIGDLG